MVGVCRHGVVAAAMPAVEVASKSAGARKGAMLRHVRVASPLQSAFLRNAVLPHRHLKTCAFARCGAVSVSASTGDSGARILGERAPEAYFYSGSALGQSAAGGKRVEWEIASVAGAEKEAAASSSSEDAPFASWSHLGFNGGKRNDLKKILVLGAGILLTFVFESFLALFQDALYVKYRSCC